MVSKSVTCFNRRPGLDLQKGTEKAEGELRAARSGRKKKFPTSHWEVLRPPLPLFPPVNGFRRSSLMGLAPDRQHSEQSGKDFKDLAENAGDVEADCGQL